MGLPRVQEGDEADTLDIDCELHGAAGAGLDARQHVEGYRWLDVVHVTIVDDLNDDELFAELLVAIGEEFVAVEAFAILVVLGYL
jgi:hypothetical protein